jgi:hypothetical protein
MSTNQNGSPAEKFDTRTAPDGPPRFQFSLFSMFVVTTAVAITCSLTFSMPVLVALPGFVLVSMIVTAVLITVIVYGRGYQRTFCIGAVVPFGVLLFALAFDMVILFLDGPPGPRGDALAFRLTVVGFWASSILAGAICAGVRRLIERRRAAAPPTL